MTIMHLAILTTGTILCAMALYGAYMNKKCREEVKLILRQAASNGDNPEQA